MVSRVWYAEYGKPSMVRGSAVSTLLYRSTSALYMSTLQGFTMAPPTMALLTMALLTMSTGAKRSPPMTRPPKCAAATRVEAVPQ